MPKHNPPETASLPDGLQILVCPHTRRVWLLEPEKPRQRVDAARVVWAKPPEEELPDVPALLRKQAMI